MPNETNTKAADFYRAIKKETQLREENNRLVFPKNPLFYKGVVHI